MSGGCGIPGSFRWRHQRSIEKGHGGTRIGMSTAPRILQQRMERFDAPMVADQDTEWKQTEKRLDNWLESFLASDAAVHHERDRVRASVCASSGRG